MKVLIVDDNKNDRMLLAKTLESNAYETAQACNGIEALASIKASKPYLIISDIMMPGMDGFTFLRNLKQDDNFKDLPFVFYTAHYMDRKDKELAESLGASRFIVKPEEPIDLRYEIDMVIKEHAAGRLKPVETILGSDKEYLKQYTERIVQKLEEQYHNLEETKNFLDTLLNNMGDGVIATDPQLDITYCNKRMQQIAERNIEHGVNLSEIIPDPVHASRKLFEANVPGKNGGIVNIEGGMTPVINEGGQLSAYVGVFRDVTERNLAREEIEKKNLELRTLYDFDRLLSICTSSDELVERALKKIPEIIPIQGSCLYLVDMDSKKVVARKCTGIPSDFVELIDQQPLDNPAVNTILSSKEPVMISTMLERSTMSERIPDILKNTQKYADAQIVMVHLQSKAKIIGFIDLMVSPDKELGNNENSMLRSIGMHIGISLENLLIYEHLEHLVEVRTQELMEKNEELEKMNDLFVGRELYVIELKEKLKYLESH